MIYSYLDFVNSIMMTMFLCFLEPVCSCHHLQYLKCFKNWLNFVPRKYSSLMSQMSVFDAQTNWFTEIQVQSLILNSVALPYPILSWLGVNVTHLFCNKLRLKQSLRLEMLVQACLRAPHVVADEAKLAIVFTYFFLLFFSFFSSFFFIFHFFHLKKKISLTFFTKHAI